MCLVQNHSCSCACRGGCGGGVYAACRPFDHRREVVGHSAAGRRHVEDGGFVARAETAFLVGGGWVADSPVVVASTS